MKAYVCDSCGRVMSDPYRENMKEFYLDSVYEFGAILPEKRKRRKKIHLCKDCYKGLCSIAEKVRSDKKERD